MDDIRPLIASLRDLLSSVQGVIVSLGFLIAGAIAAFRPVRDWLSRYKTDPAIELSEAGHSKAIAVRQIHAASELQEICAFDLDSYGPANEIDFAELTSWWLAYPEGLWAAFQNGKPVGVFGMFPVTDAWAAALTTGSVKEKDLTPEIIKASERQAWYFSGVSLRDRRSGLSRVLPRLLCRGLHRWASHELEGAGDRAFTVFAAGSTEEGRRLLNFFNFEIVRPGDQHIAPVFRRRLDRSKLSQFLGSSRFCGCCRNEFPEI